MYRVMVRLSLLSFWTFYQFSTVRLFSFLSWIKIAFPLSAFEKMIDYSLARLYNASRSTCASTFSIIYLIINYLYKYFFSNLIKHIMNILKSFKFQFKLLKCFFFNLFIQFSDLFAWEDSLDNRNVEINKSSKIQPLFCFGIKFLIKKKWKFK